MEFRHEVIDDDPPATRLDICLVADLTGNGRDDVIVGGKEGDPTLFWYENPGWERHSIASVSDLEAGGVVVDVNGDGHLDVVAGQQWKVHDAYWFENPGDPRGEWTTHVITSDFEKYHDQAVGDIDGDGTDEILFASQDSGVLFYYDIPADPTMEPWREDHRHIIHDDISIEGLEIVDLDGDGENEIIAGPNVFRLSGHGWTREALPGEWIETRVQVADIDGDGELEILLSEGESHPGRAGWVDPPNWELHLIRDDLFHPHSFELADFTGNGRLDIYIGEMGLGRNDDPTQYIFENLGDGAFQEHVISRGIPTHEAKVANLGGDGRHDIVGKPYEPENHVDAFMMVD